MADGQEHETLSGLEKLRQVRLEKAAALRASGRNPYPYRFERTHLARAVHEEEAALSAARTPVSLAGRVVALRGHGKTAFGHLEDSSGRLQFYARRDDLGEDAFAAFALVEVGDILGVVGPVFRTRTNELTVHVERFEVLSKALRPLPEKWHGLTDKEIRYRQRYVDLIMNPEVREVFVKRSAVVETMRQFLLARAFLEVETPVLQPLYGGAAARPFTTHHNALDLTLYLRIANELYLKRLLVGGFDRVFEFSRDFRNEGIDRSHNPEFTMMECYAAYLDYTDFMDLVEEMMREIAREVCGSDAVEYGGHKIDFGRAWRRETFFGAIHARTGVDFRGLPEGEVLAQAQRLGVELEKDTPNSRALDEIFSARVEPELIEPTFIYDYPKALSPLAKDHRSEEGLVERFEPFVGGFEVGNAFSELNDPVEQRRRFQQQAALRERGDEEAHVLDEDFIRALEYGMPPAAGLGIGVDRLTMVLTDSQSIRDVVFFPQMRPEEGRGP
ncbi:MAG: lysine--tRNA ligase [Candidatus Krumholzibacteria bacterium]|nr:lysine--tRNA ligase [Candidatus Krumholzibacteria bacterium]